MALLETPNFKATKLYSLEIDKPCSGGLNLSDLEYELNNNQSPQVLNMMYRNGAFGKRYGQEIFKTYQDEIYALGYYKQTIIVHSGDKIYSGDKVLASNIAKKKGVFINFNRILYYLCEKYYQYDGEQFKEVDPYVPDVLINRKPDGSYQGDTIDDYNALGAGCTVTFHGDGKSTKYVIGDKNTELTNLDKREPIIKVTSSDGEKTLTSADYTIDYEKGEVTFKTAPPEGTNNVAITVYKTEQEYIDNILNNKYWISYGGNNNSRLFLAGGGESKYYYSDVFDATYFPESNYAKLGNSTEDITGFGEEYNILIIFKPTEMYAISYYTDNEGIGQFQTMMVNAAIGCDVPDSIQLINNLLVWCSTINGICTLVSTNIENERNVRRISSNIEGGYRIDGILQEPNLQNAKSVDFDNKYFLTVNGKAYVWDYGLQPYASTNYTEQDSDRLCWFLFDNFNVGQFVKDQRELLYSNSDKLCKLNFSFNDFGEPIHAIYQTPLFQFGAVEYLKNVTNVYIQCRGDTASIIDIKYITDENADGEKENEPIVISGNLWSEFRYETFSYFVTAFGYTFRRKCSLKKVQMASILFENNELNRDMSISHLALDYAIVKRIK